MANRQAYCRGYNFQATHDFTIYSQAKLGDLSVTDRVSREELTLPLWSYVDEAVLDRVSAEVAAFLGGRTDAHPQLDKVSARPAPTVAARRLPVGGRGHERHLGGGRSELGGGGHR
jgi:hypothetical protein